MTDTNTTNTSLAGKMFLYENPELLTTEKHGSMGFTPSTRPFDFARGARVVPLTMIEFGSAIRSYPIIFSNLETPTPLAVVGLLEDDNMFVNEEGNWDTMSYVPTYLRCHPFTLAKEAGGKLAIVVDRDAASVTEEPVYPFFTNDEPSEQTRSLMRLCSEYEIERQRTAEFCKKLVDLELLAVMQATHKPEGTEEPLADYVAIDAAKLDGLPAETIYELHKAGFLSASYLHLYSLENWRHLMARRVSLGKAD